MKLALPDNKAGLSISLAAHAAFFAWGILSFAAKPLEAKMQDSLPVDIISTEKFSEIMAGNKDAKKVAEKPKPLVDKIAEPKPAPEIAPKVTEKQTIEMSSAEPPPPPPAPEKKPEKPEPKAAESKPEPKPEPKVAEPKPEPKPVLDQIAEALKKEEAKKKADDAKRAEQQRAEQKKLAQQKALEEQKRREAEQPKFDASKIAALLDKRNPQRVASTGAEYNPTPSLGAPSALAMRMSQNELDAMRARLMKLWSPPAGVSNPDELVVRVRISLGRDGKLTAHPVVIGGKGGSMYQSARDSAVRALFAGQPYDMLTPANYEIWKDVEILFDPREMYRG